jgi:putative aminopeptidase FrvX
MLPESSLAFLKRYLNNASPTGFESSGQQMWLDYIRPWADEYIVDTYGSVVGVVNPNAPYKVVIEAHADEIAWFVSYITKDGYIYVKRNGGSDPTIAPSMRVNIHTAKGLVQGVFGWPAIHVREPETEKVPKIHTLCIDIGAESKEEAEAMGVLVGCVAVFQDQVSDSTNGKYLIGRALDNRVGGFMIAETLRILREHHFHFPFGLYVVNAVQEEIGLRGAEMIAHRIQPDVAVITDVTHDTQSPFYNKMQNGDIACGKGPVLTYGPAVQNNLLNMIIGTAEQYQIPFQRQAASRITGTDTDAFAYSNAGVASALISIPLKYMHTTVETVAYADIEHVINLFVNFLKQLPAGHDFRYIK